MARFAILGLARGVILGLALKTLTAGGIAVRVFGIAQVGSARAARQASIHNRHFITSTDRFAFGSMISSLRALHPLHARNGVGQEVLSLGVTRPHTGRPRFVHVEPRAAQHEYGKVGEILIGVDEDVWRGQIVQGFVSGPEAYVGLHCHLLSVAKGIGTSIRCQ